MGKTVCVDISIDFSDDDLIDEMQDRGLWSARDAEDRRIIKALQKGKYGEALDLLWEKVEGREADRRAEKYLEWRSTAHGHMTQ